MGFLRSEEYTSELQSQSTISYAVFCLKKIFFNDTATTEIYTLSLHDALPISDIKKYAEQKKADWILNGGIDEEWDSYLKKMEKYGLSDYLSIKQKYFDQYQDSLSSEK